MGDRRLDSDRRRPCTEGPRRRAACLRPGDRARGCRCKGSIEAVECVKLSTTWIRRDRNGEWRPGVSGRRAPRLGGRWCPKARACRPNASESGARAQAAPCRVRKTARGFADNAAPNNTSAAIGVLHPYRGADCNARVRGISRPQSLYGNDPRFASKRLLPRRGGLVCRKGSLRQKSVLPAKNTKRSAQTKREMLAKLRRAGARAGSLYKRRLLHQAVSCLGYHRKAAICALRASPVAARPPGLLLG
jgi:hypothetical protein